MSNAILREGTVASADGTVIAYDVAGSGPALILVHGTGADRGRWAAVLPLLAAHFRVFAMDRRGRGGSADTRSYDIRREYEDVAALAGRLGEPVHLLGHSFGAACVLGAAPDLANLASLVLYEPPMLRAQHNIERDAALLEMDEALAAGDRERVVITLLHDLLRIPMPVIENARCTPAWQDQLRAAHTIPRELRVSDAYGRDLETLKTLRVPALFLLGSASLPGFKATTEALHAAMPASRIAVLDGQQHSAMLSAPELFAGEVVDFLLSVERTSSQKAV